MTTDRDIEAAAVPVRVQRSRAKGWKMPPNTVSVTRPGMWGNYAAMRVGVQITAEEAVAEFRAWVDLEASEAWKGRAAIDLRGKNLACWCPLTDKDGNPVPCHADVLLELANAPAYLSARTQGEGK